MIELQQWGADAAQSAMADLAEMLHASVAHGASIGFVMPFTVEQAGILAGAAAGPARESVRCWWRWRTVGRSAPCSCCWRCRTTAATGRKWPS
ncbi:hypothetical protein M8494_18340 [Serratia ureilytica]